MFPLQGKPDRPLELRCLFFLLDASKAGSYSPKAPLISRRTPDILTTIKFEENYFVILYVFFVMLKTNNIENSEAIRLNSFHRAEFPNYLFKHGILYFQDMWSNWILLLIKKYSFWQHFQSFFFKPNFLILNILKHLSLLNLKVGYCCFKILESVIYRGDDNVQVYAFFFPVFAYWAMLRAVTNITWSSSGG